MDSINRETQLYIHSHLNDNVQMLALKPYPNGVDIKFALRQIAGFQIASNKLKEWSKSEAIIYPQHISLEQSTCEDVAKYKRGFLQQLLQREHYSLFDLTGGMGVDCYYLSSKESATYYNEPNSELCEITAHNFSLLGRGDITIYNSNAETLSNQGGDYIADIIYLDPSRRSSSGKRLVSIAECAPNVLELQDALLQRSELVVVKLSPMLDISTAMRELHNIYHIHFISHCGECKEMLVVLKSGYTDNTIIGAVDIDAKHQQSSPIYSTLQGEREMSANYLSLEEIECGDYLYEPYASYMKSGLYRTIANNYGTTMLSNMSHLYISKEHIPCFPGRKFIIKEALPFNKRECKNILSKTKYANIAVRNFPLSVDVLRRRLALRDGGENYIFASTTYKDELILLLCSKAEL